MLIFMMRFKKEQRFGATAIYPIKKRDDTVKMIIEWITNEQFNGKAPKIDGEIYTWEGE